jgi:hypothetical protein
MRGWKVVNSTGIQNGEAGSSSLVLKQRGVEELAGELARPFL